MASVEAAAIGGAGTTSAVVSSAGGPFVDLALTLPIFVAYHLGVVFLPVRNAADFVTRELVALADHSVLGYSLLTLGLGGAYVAGLLVAGRRTALDWSRFALVAVEGIAYAIAMRLVAGWVVGKLSLGAFGGGAFTGLVMSLGAGFYEEVAFRVVLYGLGARLLVLLLVKEPTAPRRWLVRVGWAMVAAAVFSGWHYVGALGDPFEVRSFVFRWVCGVVFTLIYAARGFAPAVWTHALYDVWVLVL
ncbi:MAG: CPBP family intramembrane metalloprotease [Polyangiaceae bacterium]|nr:CPBP family intramembrane metalloprotease [Polyangiaceae bacterium]